MLKRIMLAGRLIIFLCLLHVFLVSSNRTVASVQPDLSAQRNTALANVIWVPDNYTGIQQAIDAASDGDTIIVRAGLYFENVMVNKTVTLLGEGFPTVEGNHSISQFGEACLYILADNVTVRGFVVQNTGLWKENKVGINLVGVGHCNISGNIFRFCPCGIKMDTGNHDHMISDNLFEEIGSGISCAGIHNMLVNNTIVSSGGGIAVHYPLNTLINNTIMNNEELGVFLNAYLITMRGNRIAGNKHNFRTVETILPQLVNDIDTSNTVDDKPMYYWINQSDRTVPVDAGYVALVNCTNISVEGMNLANNGEGVLVAFSSNCTIRDCNLTNNEFGFCMIEASNNTLYHNNLINNIYQVGNTYALIYGLSMPPNKWSCDYPDCGNYWGSWSADDTCSGVFQNETGSDGIADAPFPITGNNSDYYPSMAPLNVFDAGVWNTTQCEVHVASNSTISSFQVNQTDQTLRFNASGETGFGFCRTTIPNLVTQALWQDNYTVLVDAQPPLEIRNWTDAENTYVYFVYLHSEHEITIIPELPSTAFLVSALPLITLCLVRRRKRLSIRRS